jgi:dephospho-CoA kinase
MIKIGLTGSIAMGKSEVAKIWQAEGLPVFDADLEVHNFYNSAEGADLLSSVAADAIQNGRVDRQLLSAIIVQNPDRLKAIEVIVHAEIAKRRASFTNHAKAGSHPVVVYDIPLLFEKNLETTVDVTVLVSASESDQRHRALERPGMTAEKLNMILERQMPDAEKRKRADHIIENTGSLAQLAAKALLILRHIQRTTTP